MRIVVDRADRKDERTDHLLSTRTLNHPCDFDVGCSIVHRIRERETADAVGRERAEGKLHEFRACRFPSDETKAGRKKLQRSCGARFCHAPYALPRVFLLVAHGHAHMGACREVDRLEAAAFHCGRYRECLGCINAKSAPKALVAVAQRRLDELDRCHRLVVRLHANKRLAEFHGSPVLHKMCDNGAGNASAYRIH